MVEGAGGCALGGGARFGACHRARKACSWLASALLQAVRPPAAARGATLVATARVAA